MRYAMPFLNQHAIDAAEAFADGAHRAMKQRRQVTGEPYIVHPRTVAMLLRAEACTQPVVMAGLLHDVVEDTGVTRQDIAEVFGQEVAALVDEVTNITVPADGCRAVRASIERAHLKAASADAHDIKLADCVANLREVRNLKPDFAKVYVGEKVQLIPELSKGREELRLLAAAELDRALDYIKGLK